MAKKRIAVTGGIATGKSTVMSWFQERGVRIASADEIARDVFNDPAVQKKIADVSGLNLPISRARLRHAISVDPVIRRQVNAAMHPEIVERIRQSEAQLFEVPLLVETCLFGEFDEVWMTVCEPEEQIQRLILRLGDRESAENLIRTQLSIHMKVAFADSIIRTNSEVGSVLNDIFRKIDSEIG